MTQNETFTKRKTSPYRYDVVGSYLRPQALKDAREAFEAGEIDKEVLTQVEDKEIIKLIKKQEEAGLKAVTDGEFRRSWWHLDFFWGLEGIDFHEPEHGYFFHGEETRPGTVIVTGKISGENHPFVEDYKFTRAHASEGVEVKQTLPAPAQLLVELLSPDNRPTVDQYYESLEALFTDITKAYKQVLADLYDAGARVIQFDDCTWGVLVAPLPAGFVSEDGKDERVVREELKKLYLALNNSVFEGLPEDLVVNTHVCRGNYHSTWAATGGYEDIADALFEKEKVDAYYLEYDSDRSGGFEPLASIKDKRVVLGLITSKTGELENRQAVIKRIYEAAAYVPLDDLCLSTQCGFASTEEGNILTEKEQWEKIAFVQSIATEVWGEN